MNGRSSSGERRTVSAHQVQRIPGADDFPALGGMGSGSGNGHSPNLAEGTAAGKTAAQVLSMPAPPKPEKEQAKQEQEDEDIVSIPRLFV